MGDPDETDLVAAYKAALNRLAEAAVELDRALVTDSLFLARAEAEYDEALQTAKTLKARAKIGR